MQERASFTRSIERALDILECFSERNTELRIVEICKMVGLSKSTTHRTMSTLENRGYLIQDQETGKYRLGVKTLAAGKSFLAGLDFRALALPYMRSIRDATGESVNLFVTNGTTRVLIERTESVEPLRRVLKIGDELPLDRGAAGKVFLAFKPELMPASPLKPETLKAIRENLYALSHGERASDASSVAAPIFDHKARLIAVLALSGPTLRFVEPRLPEFIQSICEAATSISHSLGCSPTMLNAVRRSG